MLLRWVHSGFERTKEAHTLQLKRAGCLFTPFVTCAARHVTYGFGHAGSPISALSNPLFSGIIGDT